MQQKKLKKVLTKEIITAIIIFVIRWCGSMAEQLICNQQVDGSTPFTSSIMWECSRAAKGGRL